MKYDPTISQRRLDGDITRHDGFLNYLRKENEKSLVDGLSKAMADKVNAILNNRKQQE